MSWKIVRLWLTAGLVWDEKSDQMIYMGVENSPGSGDNIATSQLRVCLQVWSRVTVCSAGSLCARVGILWFPLTYQNHGRMLTGYAKLPLGVVNKCVNVCARRPAMNHYAIQGVFLPHVHYSHDTPGPPLTMTTYWRLSIISLTNYFTKISMAVIKITSFLYGDDDDNDAQAHDVTSSVLEPFVRLKTISFAVET